jgi:hypothetical protein
MLDEYWIRDILEHGCLRLFRYYFAMDSSPETLI